MLTITKERLYGREVKGYIYRACIDDEGVATGATREEAATRARSAIKDALKARWMHPEIGKTDNGDTCVGIQTGARQYALYWHNPDGTARQGSESGRLELQGKPCTLAQYVRYSVLMRNGVEYSEAARQAVAA